MLLDFLISAPTIPFSCFFSSLTLPLLFILHLYQRGWNYFPPVLFSLRIVQYIPCLMLWLKYKMYIMMIDFTKLMENRFSFLILMSYTLWNICRWAVWHLSYKISSFGISGECSYQRPEWHFSYIFISSDFSCNPAHQVNWNNSARSWCIRNREKKKERKREKEKKREKSPCISWSKTI